MPSPGEEEDVIVPLRLEPVGARSRGFGGRSTTLVAAGLIAFIALGIGLGSVFTDHRPSRLPPFILAESTASPRLVEEPSAPPGTQRPAPSRVPLATPLPTLEISGDATPSERRLVYADGLEVLDLATGSLTRPSPPLYDAMLLIGGDQLVCACVAGGPAGSNPPGPLPTIRFGRFDLDGQPLIQRDVVSFDGVVAVPNQTDGFNATTALSDDRRTLYVLTVARRPPMWSVDLNIIDAETGELLGGRTLGRFPVDLDSPASTPTPASNPDGTPPDGAYAWAAFVAPAPDGRTVMASVQASEWRNGNGTNRNREWMVPIRDRQPGRPSRLQPDAALDPDDWCVDSPWFVDPSVAVQVCVTGGQQGPFPFYLRRLTATGASVGDVPIEGIQSTEGYLSAAFDRRTRAVFVWDPLGHTIARATADDARFDISTVPEEMRPTGPSYGRARIVAMPALVLSPDGSRAYAIGAGPNNASTGVWVFDARTLELLDHWNPRAVLNSIAISADGRFVYVTGAPRFDVDGNENPLWPASVTVYDTSNGKEQRLYGAVASDAWMTFPNWR